MSDQDIADALRELADELENGEAVDERLPDGWTDDPNEYPDPLQKHHAPYKRARTRRGFGVYVDNDGDIWVVRAGDSVCVGPDGSGSVRDVREEAQEYFNNND